MLARVLLSVLLLVAALQAAVVLGSALSTRVRRRRSYVALKRQDPRTVRVEEDDITVYTYGMSLYRDMLADIEKAERSICIESFIWKDDGIGLTFKESLIRKAGQGVAVYVIFDAFANLVVPASFKVFPATVHVCRYRAWRHFLDVIDPRRLARDHRKLLVIDEQVGYVGGYNIGDLYGAKWRDTHVRIRGPVARNLFASFAELWQEQTGRDDGPQATQLPSLQPHIRLYENNPTRIMFPIRSMYIEAIDLAKERIDLTTPYFVPDRFVLASLIRAARRGVKVRLLVPERSNHLLADWLARTYFTRCLRQGIRIFLYQGAMIHAKTATIDGTWTTVGTANLDRLSLVGNHELNLEVFHEGLAAQMEAVFERDLENCTELHLEEWLHRPLVQKLGELILSPYWPFL